MKRLQLLLLFIIQASFLPAQPTAPKPLFDDPIYHGAADPVIIYNKQEKKWWMFYTNRRATLNDSSGVAWVHGTRIGIAESKDGMIWSYKDTASINYRRDKEYTFWAPDVIENNGLYHMYLTYVPGIFQNWNHPRTIVHLTSKDLVNWQYESTLPLVNEKVIDASVFRLPDGNWRMWYNNERDGKSIYYADSKDLYTWTGTDNQAFGGHCDVVVNDGKAYVYYFTHPGRRKDKPVARNSFDDKRSVIQVAELKYTNGEISCDRNEDITIRLKPGK
jgi:hypothetical protein